MRSFFSFAGGALLVSAPIAVLLSGCGGGNGGLVTPTATPTTMAATATPIGPTPTGTAPTPTPTSTSVAVALGSAPVSFGNGQSGTLTLTHAGNGVSGTLVVNAATNQNLKGHSTRAFTFSIAAGTYQVSGTFTPPRGFEITGNFPAPIGTFSIKGTIPTTSSPGSYTITAGGQTVTGTYPQIGSSVPTPTPAVTATPQAANGSFSGTITGSGDANFGTAVFRPTTFSGTKSTQGSITVFAVTATEVSSTRDRGLVVTLSSASGGFTKGQVLPATASGALVLPNAHVTPVISQAPGAVGPGSWGNFTVKKGTVTITDLTATSLTLTLKDVEVEGDYGAAKGALTVNGTLTSKYTIS